jgi:hypothetical protein
MINTLLQIRRFSSSTLGLLATVVSNGCAATPHSTSVSDIVARPAAYNGQRLTVIGVATGDGPAIEVFASVADARGLDSKKALFVRSKVRKSGQVRSDMRKVRVTGQVHAEDHGIWGNPCALRSATIEVLSDRLAAADPPPGVFRNESQLTITVSIAGQVSTQFELAPGTADTQPLSRVCTVEIRAQDKTLLARKTIVQSVKTPYYDRVIGVLYYRFANGRIEQVLPGSGRKWPVKSI